MKIPRTNGGAASSHLISCPPHVLGRRGTCKHTHTHTRWQHQNDALWSLERPRSFQEIWRQMGHGNPRAAISVTLWDIWKPSAAPQEPASVQENTPFSAPQPGEENLKRTEDDFWFTPAVLQIQQMWLMSSFLSSASLTRACLRARHGGLIATVSGLKLRWLVFVLIVLSAR